MFSSVQSHIGASILGDAWGGHRCDTLGNCSESSERMQPPKNKLVEASGKECLSGDGSRSHLLSICTNIWTGKKKKKKEKWQHYEILTSGNCELYSFYTNLMHILTLQLCLTAIRVSLKEMHCMKRILATQDLLAGAWGNNKWNTCAQHPLSIYS